MKTSRTQSSQSLSKKPQPLICQVCCEPQDKTDKLFTPCTCGYQICVFCYHKICSLNTQARSKCPNCRKPYSSISNHPSPVLRKSPTSVTNQKPKKSALKGRAARRTKSVEKAAPLDLKVSVKKKSSAPKKGYSFYMFQYKCKPCTKQRCQAKVFCPGFHHQGERRRNPQIYKYSYEPCPAVKENHKWRDASRCEKGDACDKAHTLLEQMYHPYIYKTSLCANYPKNQCSWGDFCTHAHGEVRAPTMPTGGPGTNIPKDKPKSKSSPLLNNSKSQPAAKKGKTKPNVRILTLAGSGAARSSPWAKTSNNSNSAPAVIVPPPPPRDKPVWGNQHSAASIASSAMSTSREVLFRNARGPSSVTSSAAPLRQKSLPNSPGFHKAYSPEPIPFDGAHSQFEDRFPPGESLDLSSVFPDEHSPLKDLYHPNGQAEGIEHHELSSIQEHENHDLSEASLRHPSFNQKSKSSLSVFTDDSQGGSVTSDAQTQFSFAFDKPLRIGQSDRLTLEREVVSLREKMADLEHALRNVTAERDSLKSQLRQVHQFSEHEIDSYHDEKAFDSMMISRRLSQGSSGSFRIPLASESNEQPMFSSEHDFRRGYSNSPGLGRSYRALGGRSPD